MIEHSSKKGSNALFAATFTYSLTLEIHLFFQNSHHFVVRNFELLIKQVSGNMLVTLKLISDLSSHFTLLLQIVAHTVLA